MHGATPVADLERRKRVRLTLRPDLVIVPQQYEARTFYMIKDPVSLRYFRFEEQEHFLLRRLDGRTTLEEVRAEFERRYRPERLRLEDLEGFSQRLLRDGLAASDSPQAGVRLYEESRRRWRRRWLLTVSNPLYIKIPLFDPDQLLSRLLPWLRWLFSGLAVLVTLSLMLAALLLVLAHFDVFRRRLPSLHEFFGLRTLVYLWLALGIVKVLHEFAHGLTCKAFGGEVHEMGLLLLCFSPCLYCNVSDAWTLPSKWRRMAVGFAGIYVELLVAAGATFVWWNTPGQTFVNSLCLCLMFLCSVNTVLLNGNPLMRFDGYYVFADWLEVPNLRERAGRFLKDAVMTHLLGLEVPPGPPMARGRCVLFVTYALASQVYFWVVAVAILWFLYHFLEPYKLGAVGGLLALFSAGSMLAWPLSRAVQGYRRRGRLPDFQPGRGLLSAAVLAGLVLLAGLVPLPIADLHQIGVIEFPPEAQDHVYVRVPGVLERLHVRDGELVEKDQVLAELRSLELENRLAEVRNEHDIVQVKIRGLQQQVRAATDVTERTRLESALAAALGGRGLHARQTEVYEAALGMLVLRAPRAGVVVGAPRREEMGKLWAKDAGVPFCRIGDPGRLRVVVAVSPPEYLVLHDEIAAAGALPAAVRGCGHGWRLRGGLLSRLPDAEAHDIPLALSTRASGPVPVKAGTGQALVPLSQRYLLAIDLSGRDLSLVPGTLAQVTVRCRWHSCGWWLWRTIASTLEPGLL